MKIVLIILIILTIFLCTLPLITSWAVHPLFPLLVAPLGLGIGWLAFIVCDRSHK